MELTELKPSERVIELVHPKTEEPIGVRITLVSLEDERTKKIKRRFMDERLRLEARGKHFSASDLEENQFQLTFATMTGWEWYGEDVTFNGESNPAFNQKNVFAFLKACPYFASQIQKEVEDEKAFF